MINLRFRAAREGFFDTALVAGAVDSATRKVLSRFGAFVRTRARTSIRKKKGTSPPGGPPYSKVGTLRQFLFFSYDQGRKSVVIGPARLGSTEDPESLPRLEYGGDVAGNGRVAFISNDLLRNARTGRFKSGGKTRVVLNGTLHYQARPFMGPAFAAELPGMPAMWKDSVR